MYLFIKLGAECSCDIDSEPSAIRRIMNLYLHIYVYLPWLY